MSLQVAVAAPFKQHGRDTIEESEFVVALSLDRDWLSPDQAKRLLDLAAGEGLVERADGEVAAALDYDAVSIPEEFTPDESLFRERSAFERVLDDLVGAGMEKQEAVAEVNKLQQRLGVTVEAAAVVYARRHDVDVDDAAERARGNLVE
jgi:hypothetical protein